MIIYKGHTDGAELFDCWAEKFRWHNTQVQTLPMAFQMAPFPLWRVFVWVLESGLRAVDFFPLTGDSNST